MKLTSFSAYLVSIVAFSLSSGLAHAGRYLTTSDPVPGSYIVVLNGDGAERGARPSVAMASQALAAKYSVEVGYIYQHALSGFSVKGTAAHARKLAQDPSVDYVVEDGYARASITQSPAVWGIDRVDQRRLPLSSSYDYEQTGTDVNVYVLDSGIRRTHAEFQGRVTLDFTAINDGRGAEDCTGHGTHVAGTIGSTTFGVAKAVRLHSIRVLGCNGSGQWAGVIAGIDWVTANRIRPAVANMSLSGGANQAVDDAVNRSIRAGVTYVIAAGNNNGANACDFSPARTRNAITVAATMPTDARAGFSNIGTCIDMFAPGHEITSTWFTSDTATRETTGTSMAAPHVAGAAALFLQTSPNATPADVSNALQRMVTYGRITGAGAGSPNHLLYSRPSTVRRAAFFRYLNTVTRDHFYTSVWGELGGGGFGAWNYEGVQGYLATTHIANTTPLYRYFNKNNSDHFYTTNWGELGAGGSGGWVYEGIAGYVPTVAASDTANLYRYYNTQSGDHFYTTNWAELGGGGANGWIYEGVQCLIWNGP